MFLQAHRHDTITPLRGPVPVAEDFLMRSNCTNHEENFIALPISHVRAPYPVAPLTTTEEKGEDDCSLHMFSMVLAFPNRKEKFVSLPWPNT